MNQSLTNGNFGVRHGSKLTHKCITETIMDKPLFVIEITKEITPKRIEAKTIFAANIVTATEYFYEEIEKIERNLPHEGFTYSDHGNLQDARVALIEGNSKYPYCDWEIEYSPFGKRYFTRFIVREGRIETKTHFLPYSEYRKEFRRQLR